MFRILHDDNMMEHFLQFMNKIQSPAAFSPFQIIRRIGKALQLIQHKMGNHKISFQKTGFQDICNTPVYDHTGIKELIERRQFRRHGSRVDHNFFLQILRHIVRLDRR